MRVSKKRLDRRDTARRTRHFSWRAVTGRQPAAKRWRQLRASVHHSTDLCNCAQTPTCYVRAHKPQNTDNEE